MMLGNVNPGPSEPPPSDPGPPAPLISKILYIWGVLNVVGSFILLLTGEAGFAIGGFVSGLILFAIGMYLHQQSARSEEMIELMKEQNRRRR